MRGVPPGDCNIPFKGDEPVRDESIACPEENDFPWERGWRAPQGRDQQMVAALQGRGHAMPFMAEPGLRRNLARSPVSLQPLERSRTHPSPS